MTTMNRRELAQVLATLACCCLLIGGSVALAAAPSAKAIRFGRAEKVGSSVVFGLPIDFEICPDGGALVADMLGNLLTRISPAGEVSWQSGRAGQGPGEFQGLYRVACGLDGRVAAYDMTNQEVSWFTANGEYVDRGRLDTHIEFFDGMAVLSDGRLAVAGVSAGAHGIHVFDSELRHVESFGSLPPSRNPRALRYWGAGGMNLDASGNILYTLRVPYQIYVFSQHGQELSRLDAPFEMLRGPDDNYIETRTSTGYKISANPEFVKRPLPAHDVGDGWLLAGRLDGPDAAIWDLFHDGRFVESFASPESWFFVAAVDRSRSLLYVQSTDEEGNSEFLRVPYRLFPNP